MSLSTLLVVLTTIVVLSYLWIKSKFSYWEKRSVLHIPPKMPMGNLSGVAKTRNLFECIGETYNSFRGLDKICGFYSMTAPIVIPLDLDLIRNILIKDFNNFHDRGMYVNEKADPLSGHLFSLSGLKWKNMRNKMSPTFTSGKMKQMFHIMSEKSENLIKHVNMHPKKAIDVKNLTIRFTADIIGSCAFGIECNCLIEDDSKYFKIAQKTVEFTTLRFVTVFFTMNFKRLSKFLGLKINQPEVIEYFLGITRENVKYREEVGTIRNDFLSLLIQNQKSEKDESEHLTLEEMTAQCFIFFIAGFETSSTTTSWCLFELAKNQDIQERLRLEINKVMKKYDGKITYEGIHEMQYLEQVVNETLRKYSTVQALLRLATEDYKVPDTDHIIEKGTQVFIPTQSIHNDDKIYPDPSRFDPERFTAENMAKRHPFAFLPFGEGPRNCVGMRFGLMQTKLGIATLINKYRFKVNKKTRETVEFEPSVPGVQLRGGIWLDAEDL